MVLYGPRGNLRRWAIAAGVAALLALPVLGAQWSQFGSPFTTPYVIHTASATDATSDQSIRSYRLDRIPNAALGMFVNPRWAGASDVTQSGLLVDMPWAVLAVPGFVLIGRKLGRNRRLAVAFASMWILSSLFYLSFRASGPVPCSSAPSTTSRCGGPCWPSQPA